MFDELQGGRGVVTALPDYAVIHAGFQGRTVHPEAVFADMPRKYPADHKLLFGVVNKAPFARSGRIIAAESITTML